MNDLIRKARKEQDEVEYTRAALIVGEKSGFSSRTPEDVKKLFLKDCKIMVNYRINDTALEDLD